MAPFLFPDMAASPNIFLIGPMGSGKSTIGRRLARHLHKTFVDSDHVIEERTGVDIPTIFDIEGEEGFRKREMTVINELSQKKELVLATGGGAILNPENRAHLMARGLVIYLKTSVQQQLARTQHDKNRPLLQTEDPKKKLTELLQHREPYYLDMADIVIDTNHRHSNQVVREIQKKLQELDGWPL